MKCPKCKRPIIQTTTLCSSYNPIFDCELGLKGVIHTHYFCTCGFTEVKEGIGND